MQTIMPLLPNSLEEKTIISRRSFLSASTIFLGAAAATSGLSVFAKSPAAPVFDFEISLAQWSLHKALFAGEMSALDFPGVARETYGIGAVEYVNQFFMDKAKDKKYLKQLKARAEDNGVISHLIMIDGEPEMSSPDKKVRIAAVEGHKKWVEAASALECAAIRVNLHGTDKQQEWVQYSTETFVALCDFAKDFNIKVLVENHGGFSSNGKLLSSVIKNADHAFGGTMPDFGNFCVRREADNSCADQYDMYKGVAELLPYAGAVSAKTFDFDDKGNETTIDYRAMLKLVRAASYQGYIGIEYEGSRLSEDAGIKATKALLEKIRAEMSKPVAAAV